MAEQPRAACADTTEPEVFFPDFRGRPGINSKAKVKRHLNMVWNAYCSHCPITRECALEGRKPGNWGIWGGMYFHVEVECYVRCLVARRDVRHGRAGCGRGRNAAWLGLLHC